jgi:hypothetical protein
LSRDCCRDTRAMVFLRDVPGHTGRPGACAGGRFGKASGA